MQYKYHNIIFDLDGTLINSGPGIIHAVQYALKKYGINETNMTVLKSFVGPPLNQQFISCYNFSHEQSFEAVKYFAFAGGSLLDGSRINKDDVLAYVLKQMQITDLNDCIMVGDRKYDVIGAKKFNLKCVGVTYGYGSLEELKDINADFIIDKPLELLSIIK